MLIIKKYTINDFNPNGFTLIEVLICMMVFSVGVISVIHLQSTNIRGIQSATNRVNAIWLLNDITEKIHNNPSGGVNGFYNYDSSSPPGGPICTFSATGGCTGEEIANFDIQEWHNMLIGSPPTIKPFLPGAQAQITSIGNGAYAIAISWQDINDGQLQTYSINEQIVFFNSEQMSTYAASP